MDLEKTAIERLKAASDMSLRLYKQPLVITYGGILLAIRRGCIPLVDGGRRNAGAGGIGWIQRNLTSACSAITHG